MPMIKEVKMTLTVIYEDGKVADLHTPLFCKNTRGGAIMLNKEIMKAMRMSYRVLVRMFKELKTKGIYQKIVESEKPARGTIPPFSVN